MFNFALWCDGLNTAVTNQLERNQAVADAQHLLERDTLRHCCQLISLMVVDHVSGLLPGRLTVLFGGW